MSDINIKQTDGVKEKMASFPNEVKPRIESLRTLIIETASELDHITEMLETLKWGELSYLVKKGSTIRINWSPKKPEVYSIYFVCSTSLVETFKMLYGDLFQYEKNRAIHFGLDDVVPKEELKHCISLALRYHILKDKPFLGQ